MIGGLRFVASAIHYNFWEYAYIFNGRHSALTQLGLLARALIFFRFMDIKRKPKSKFAKRIRAAIFILIGLTAVGGVTLALA